MLSVAFFNGYVSLAEILWTIIGLVGLAIVGSNLNAARVAFQRVVTSSTNGDMEMLAGAHVRREAIRVFKMLVMVLIGVIAMATPPANPDAPVTALSYVLTVGLFAFAGLTVLDSFLDRTLRIKLKGG